jgi:hypothetical protein
MAAIFKVAAKTKFADGAKMTLVRLGNFGQFNYAIL